MSNISKKCTKILPDGSTVEEIQEIECTDRKIKRGCMIAAIVMLLAGCGIVVVRLWKKAD